MAATPVLCDALSLVGHDSTCRSHRLSCQQLTVNMPEVPCHSAASVAGVFRGCATVRLAEEDLSRIDLQQVREIGVAVLVLVWPLTATHNPNMATPNATYVCKGVLDNHLTGAAASCSLSTCELLVQICLAPV